jgi:hypothetical protein
MRIRTVLLPLAFVAAGLSALAPVAATIDIDAAHAMRLNANFSGFNDEVALPAESFDKTPLEFSISSGVAQSESRYCSTAPMSSMRPSIDRAMRTISWRNSSSNSVLERVCRAVAVAPCVA